MKKDRNAFFSDYSFSNMNQSANMMGGGAPNPGMAPWPQMGPNQAMPMPMPTDIDSRIAKLERQINRLETRVSKLEGEFQMPMPLNEEYNYSNSMYMV